MGFLDGGIGSFPTKAALTAPGVTHATADEAGQMGNIGTALEELRHLFRRVETFSTMPAFVDGTITYTDGTTANHQYDLSIQSGSRLRLTGGSAITSNNLRRIYGHTPSGIMGDSEVRSTFYGTSLNWNTTDNSQQVGHCHRMTRTRVPLTPDLLCTVSGGSTIGATTPGWASAQFIGAGVGYKEVWVEIVDGDGTGQKRRVISNNATTLTVFPAWTTAPSTSTGSGLVQSRFEVYAYEVRAITVVMGLVFGPFAGHTWTQANIWDNGSYRQPHNGPDIDLKNYIRPLGAFGSYNAFPWHLKSRVIGNQIDMALWSGSDSEPAYGTVNQSASWSLDGPGSDDYGYGEEPGYSGLYAGHFNAGDWFEWDDLTVIRQ